MPTEILPKTLSELNNIEIVFSKFNQKFRDYVESNQELITKFPKGYPDVNAKIVIDKRLFNNKRWSDISKEFNNIPVKTLINFWNQTILSLLAEIAEELV